MNTNDLLLSWLEAKAKELKTDFCGQAWASLIEASIRDDLKTQDKEKIAQELETHLVNAIVDGRRNGYWPWAIGQPDAFKKK